MHESSIQYLRCVRCSGNLEADILRQSSEIEEGFLHCARCGTQFPIIAKIAILRDFVNYLSNRPRLGGDLILASRTGTMRSFIKKSLTQIKKNQNDLSITEKRWAGIYDKNRNSRFYVTVKNRLDYMELSGIIVEHGCSVGIIAKHLAGRGLKVFGIDRSYHALTYAKKSSSQNLDYFVADSLKHPFGRSKFDAVVALNLFELIEPRQLLKSLSNQVLPGGFLVLSDPYDYERGGKSVGAKMREDAIRAELEKNGFSITKDTQRPSFIQWNLRLYDRAALQYKVDLVIGKNVCKRHAAKTKSF